MIHGMATNTAAAVPQVPGAGLMNPTPPAVAANRGRSGTRDQAVAAGSRAGAETAGASTSGIDIKFAKAAFDQLDKDGNRLLSVIAIG